MPEPTWRLASRARLGGRIGPTDDHELLAVQAFHFQPQAAIARGVGRVAPRAALDAIAAIRPRARPNLLMLEFGDALLGRNGEIVVATGAIYRLVLACDPEFVDQVVGAGRDREVSAAYRETG